MIKGQIGIIYKLYNSHEIVIWARFHSEQHVVKLQNNSPKTENRIAVSAGYESTSEHLMFTYCKILKTHGTMNRFYACELLKSGPCAISDRILF